MLLLGFMNGVLSFMDFSTVHFFDVLGISRADYTLEFSWLFSANVR